MFVARQRARRHGFGGEVAVLTKIFEDWWEQGNLARLTLTMPEEKA